MSHSTHTVNLKITELDQNYIYVIFKQTCKVLFIFSGLFSRIAKVNPLGIFGPKMGQLSFQPSFARIRR